MSLTKQTARTSFLVALAIGVWAGASAPAAAQSNPDQIENAIQDPRYALYWNGYPAGLHPLTNGSGEFLMTEFPLAFWLEKEGYDVTYISNVDTHADGSGPLRRKASPGR